MSPHSDRWLAALWPVVRRALPPPPARVVELGCGPLGGVVPMLRADGYDAVGVDPNAPDEPHYLRVEFELAELPANVDAVVASTSLHHVADPAEVVERLARLLGPRGTLVVVEWDWAHFDDETAAWCFTRLDPEGEPGWLHRRHEGWIASGEPWRVYFLEWARSHGLHDTRDLLRLLDASFERLHLERGAYFFPGLAGTTEADELEAIREGRIRAARVDYAGRPRPAAALSRGPSP
jgi:SAM-dependent methyltransferase